jgi:feruloyl-CoA synthase
VRAFFRDMIQRLYRQGSGSASRVVRGLVLAEPPSIDLGEMTDKGSINQRAVLAHRSADVERLYGDDPEVLRVPGAVPAETGP